MTDEQKNITWKPGWFVDRLHAEVGEGSANAACGFTFPHIYPAGGWFEKKLSSGPPKCKKCLAALEKIGHVEKE